MKIELKIKIANLINAHRSTMEQCTADMRVVLDKWKAPSTISKYSHEYYCSAVQEELDSVTVEADKTDMVLNQQLKTVVAEVKNEVLPFISSKPNKPADYATQVNNALQFLNLEGDELTDEKAFKILKPFLDDFEQMDLFADVVEKQIGYPNFIDSQGGCRFEKTFGKINRIRTLLNLFNEVEAIAENIFLFPKVEGEFIGIIGKFFTTKKDGYSETSSESNILNLCDAIENIVADIPEPMIQEI